MSVVVCVSVSMSFRLHTCMCTKHVTLKSLLYIYRSSAEKVEVDADFLRENVHLVGGSYTGIFVDDIGKTDGPDPSLTAGDQIIQVDAFREVQHVKNHRALHFVKKCFEWLNQIGPFCSLSDNYVNTFLTMVANIFYFK